MMSTRSSPSVGSVAVSGSLGATPATLRRLSPSSWTTDSNFAGTSFDSFQAAMSVWAPGKTTSSPPAATYCRRACTTSGSSRGTSARQTAA